MEIKLCSFILISCRHSVLLHIYIYFKMKIFCTFFIWPRIKPTYLPSNEILIFIQISTSGRDLVIQIGWQVFQLEVNPGSILTLVCYRSCYHMVKRTWHTIVFYFSWNYTHQTWKAGVALIVESIGALALWS